MATSRLKKKVGFKRLPEVSKTNKNHFTTEIIPRNIYVHVSFETSVLMQENNTILPKDQSSKGGRNQ